MGMFCLIGRGLKMVSNFPKTTQTWLEAWKNSPLLLGGKQLGTYRLEF